MTLKNKIINFKKERIDQGYKIDNDILNITYWVAKNYCPKIDQDDICIIYDNLDINSQIIDPDNIDDYDSKTIVRLTSHKVDYIKSQLKKGYFYLLDFYYVDNRGYGIHKDNVCLKFKYGYDALNK